jgi:hypothetical protein
MNCRIPVVDDTPAKILTLTFAPVKVWPLSLVIPFFRKHLDGRLTHEACKTFHVAGAKMHVNTHYGDRLVSHTGRSNQRCARGVWLFSLMLPLATGVVSAQIAMDEESPWPRECRTNGNTATIYQPQVETWTKNSFTGLAAVELKLAGEKTEWAGVVWFAADGSVDESNRIVNLDHFDITRVQFPEAKDGGSNALAVMRELVPSGARTVSLDYLITALGFAQAAAREGLHGYNYTPPEIIWATNRTVLILIDGEPAFRPVPGGNLHRVINTPALLLKAGDKLFLAGDGRWFTADSIQGTWALSQMPPPEVAVLGAPPATNPPAGTYEGTSVPRIIVSTHPAELLQTSGMPDFKSIPGTSLQYATDTDSQLFFDSEHREAYLLISGRWFKAKSLIGPWDYVPPQVLPAGFAKIPSNSPQAIVLASVPGTQQVKAALLAISTPTTASVNRHDAKIQLEYDGEPQFKSITGTDMSYAVNAKLPVILVDGTYYAVDNGVWFTAAAATGPWEVATEVPEKIYTIPPDSPVYYATFVHVYESTNDVVEVGYTPGYEGAYEDDGTVVYGTGCNYDPWCGDSYYYGWGWSWGYGYVYVPWYGCWVWRDWWDHPGTPRYGLIDNVYDRWREGDHVVPHDRSLPAVGSQRAGEGWGNYPAVYGRFQGSTRPAALTPPANTLALNPYARPQGTIRPGEIPHGAALLTTVRQSPGGGRDLYAAPDGQVYLRKNDGWYRRQSGGKWSHVAPLQGATDRNRIAPTGQSIQSPANLSAAQNARAQAVANRPDSGATGQVDVSALEREYAARQLGQQRQQYNRPAVNNVRRSTPAYRPVRSGGGGRRR